MFSRQHALEHL